MEDIIGIAKNIKERLCDEFSKGYSNRAVARVYCERAGGDVTYFLTNKANETVKFGHDFVGNVTTIVGMQAQPNIGTTVYKNTLLGRALIGQLGVDAQYKAPKGIKTVRPVNRAVYVPFGENAEDVQISLAGDANHYVYSSLNELLAFKAGEEAKLQEKQDQLEALQREQERLRQEEAEAKARAEEAERARLEAERIQREQDARERREEIARIQQNIAAAEENIKKQRDILHKNVMLRSQHILDPYQEDAKRSHIYDGIPIVIDGGPGTGKTTTVIQRLKFLLSKESLKEYEAPLSDNQLSRFDDPHRWSQQWLFFSPTDLLLQFLRHNMHEEELNANETNTRTIERFRKVMLREYGIIDPANPRFIEWKDRSGDLLILQPKLAIDAFEKFCIDQIKQKRDKIVSLDVSDYVWSREAKDLKEICQKNDVVDLNSLMRLLEALYEKRDDSVKSVEDILKEELEDLSVAVKRSIMKDDAVSASLRDLFSQWHNDADEDAADDVLEENDESSEAERIDFDTELYTNVRKLIRNIGLKKVDANARIRGRQQELYKIVEPFIEQSVDEESLKNIGEYVLFSKIFTSFSRGTENLFINKIPQMYKLFRKEMLVQNDSMYNNALLEKIIRKDSNRCLHADEQNLLIGLVNNALYTFSNAFGRKFRARFLELKGKSAKAYKEFCRPIIGIDEATDYTLMDYYCMISFRFYDFSSITLSGDLMQGMRKNGIQSWEELRDLFPNLEVFSLNISYRQTPTLVDMARDLYKDSLGEYPAYNSKKIKMEDDAKPILMISDDMSQKVEWICKRILDIYKKYDLLPSIAIFVGDDVDVGKFIEEIEDTYILKGIDVVDCTGGKTLDSKEVVRVFRLSEIKGMEFEAAFFYDIDTAIQGKSNELMRRNLYVGVSRAASHLAATMTTADGNESIIKYFETENAKW